MRRERHDDWLLLYCVDGRAELEAQGRVHGVEAGDLLMLPCGTPHAYRADADTPWTIYWVHFLGEEAGVFMDNIVNPAASPVLSVGVRSALVSGFRKTIELMDGASGNSIEAFIHAGSHLRQMLTFLILTSSGAVQNASDRKFLENVDAMMQNHIDGHLTLEELARQASMSKYHFAKKYSTLAKQSPIDRFIRLKMQKACRLLDTSTAHIDEIGARLGYDDPYYFSRAFKKIQGCSPRQYRTSNKG